MLVLTRKPNQQIRIDDRITVTVIKARGRSVQIGIEAPRDVRIVRGELPSLDHVDSERPAATQITSHDEVRERGLLALRKASDDAPASSLIDRRRPQAWNVSNMRDRARSSGTTASAGSGDVRMSVVPSSCQVVR